MITGTTPSFIFKLPDTFSMGSISNVCIDFEQARQVRLAKKLSDCEIAGQNIILPLSQAETLRFRPCIDCYFQLKILNTSNKIAISDIFVTSVERAICKEVLTSGESNEPSEQNTNYPDGMLQGGFTRRATRVTVTESGVKIPVQLAEGGGVIGGVTSVNGQTGDVILTAEDLDTMTADAIMALINPIASVIPSDASPSNKLTSEDMVRFLISNSVWTHDADASAHPYILQILNDKVGAYEFLNLLSKVDGIERLIPSQASATNQLGDKNFINSSINSVTAFYITVNADGDPFNTKAELENATVFYSGGEVRTPTRNDYAFVLADESKTDPITGEAPSTRYIYNNGWEFQFIVNKTTLTAAQLAAMNSGITASKVSKIDEIDDKQNLVTDATENNLASFDENGQVQDSGTNISAINAAIANKQEKPSIKSALDNTLVDNTIYRLGYAQSVNINLPATADGIITVIWYNGSTPITPTFPADALIPDYTPKANTRVEVNAMFDGYKWALAIQEWDVPTV